MMERLPPEFRVFRFCLQGTTRLFKQVGRLSESQTVHDPGHLSHRHFTKLVATNSPSPRFPQVQGPARHCSGLVNGTHCEKEAPLLLPSLLYVVHIQVRRLGTEALFSISVRPVRGLKGANALVEEAEETQGAG